MHLYFGLKGWFRASVTGFHLVPTKNTTNFCCAVTLFTVNFQKTPDYRYYFRFIFLLNSFSVWICQRLLRVMERKDREQKKSTRKIFGMQNFSPF